MGKFPEWKPQRSTMQKATSTDFRMRYKALRNSSGGFIARRDVRKFIFDKYNGKCYLCGNGNNLQIDHIVSVYRCAKGELPIEKLNTENNLALICAKCNNAKAP